VISLSNIYNRVSQSSSLGANNRRAYAKYKEIDDGARGNLTGGTVSVDSHLINQSTFNDRPGLNIVATLDSHSLDLLDEVSSQLLSSFPGQYHYGRDQIHLTVHEIVPGNTDLTSLNQALVGKDPYIEVMNKLFGLAPAFTIYFGGIIASESAILLPGYFLTEELPSFRTSFVEACAERGIPSRIGTQRYEPVTAHMCLTRFLTSLDGKRVIDILDEIEGSVSLSLKFSRLLLTRSDWYMRSGYAEILHEVELR